MRKHLLGLMLIAGLASCTSETESDIASSQPSAIESPMEEAALAATIAQRESGTSFASLPDRGELLAYGGARKSRQSGAYTYHPVALSEAHALNAIASGEMVLATPDGAELRIGYQSHEEHPDGNWSWIGRNDDGSSAVLTFGEKAVFGLVTRGDEQYRVRTDRTGAWVVSTDRTRLPSSSGRHAKPDFLLPPEDGMVAAAGIRHLQKAAPADAGKAAAVVDVLLGYSQGLAQDLGSQAVAMTRMVSLVTLANTAYANSGVNMRLRAVYAMQVNYADTSDNEEALQQLTGYNATTRQPITPNTAFNALRAAREEYGADLVAFVRRYREPEQTGCGIAWLLGMNQSGIQAARDAEFGYAVVSDGEDRDETDNNSYFCSDYALAHELGHLMGQAHSSEDAAGRAGVHTYSYGYREASASGFFTIMAYPLGETQLEIPHFANPQVRYQNRATGTATADNARSMNLTMPIVGQFRATVVPLSGGKFDFNKDGVSDVMWRNASDGRNTIWLSANNGTQQTTVTVANKAWQVSGIGDFNGDGAADILWRNSSNGQNQIWLAGNGSTKRAVATVGLAWQIAGVGDFNGDGVTDILWRNPTTGENTVWFSASNATQRKLATVANKAWSVARVGDFNGDGVSDILWRNSSTGQNQIWRSGNNATQQAVATVANKAWQIVGVGDFNGDGIDDVLWRNSSTGQNQIWRSANNAMQQAVATVANKAWSVVGVADFNGDGVADVLWRNSNGQNQIWRSANNGTQQAMGSVGGNAWRVVGF